VGAFYNSLQVRSENREAVKTALEGVALECGMKFLLGPVLDGWIAAYPDDSRGDEHSAAMLARSLDTLVLSLKVHDSDIFFYNLFRQGELLNEYSSKPDYFQKVSAAEHERLQARPELFRELVHSSEQFAELIQLLDRGDSAPKFILEEERLERFAALLGIRNSLTSYEYLTHGEHDGIKGWKQFIHVPDQSNEKAVNKAAEAAVRLEKQRLQKKGLLCVECLPPGKKVERIHSQCESVFDPADGSLLVRWTRRFGSPDPPTWIRFQSPWTSQTEVMEMPFASSAATGVIISFSGRWIALHDGEFKVWGRQRQQFIANIPLNGLAAEFSRDEKLLLCREEKSFSLVSLEIQKVVHLAESDVPAQGQALHPSNRFLVTRRGDHRMEIINLESGTLEKILLVGTKQALSHLLPVFEGALERANFGERTLDEWKSHFVNDSQLILNFRFSPDGRMLFCATSAGLSVLSWNELLEATEITPKPMYFVRPCPAAEPFVLDDRHYANFVYDVVLDEAQNRLLFCGIEGVIRFLNLNDGSAGILLDPPGKTPIWGLHLSPDGNFIRCLCLPPSGERHKESQRIQVWNYSALCHAGGLA
jgi:hypothetical protein